MSNILVKHDVLPLIIKLKHFTLSHNVLTLDDEGKRNLEKLKKQLGKPILDEYDFINLIPGLHEIDRDRIEWPHMWESGVEYTVYEFNYNGKKYYLVKKCSWNPDSWVCYMDIYDNYKDVKDAIKSFYESVKYEVENAKSMIEDEEVYNELEELEDYAREQLKKLK